MNFEDFAADTDSTIVLKASEPDLQGTIKLIISTEILADHLGVRNPVPIVDSIENCEAQRDKIVAACQQAFKRELSTRVTLTAADFENSAPESPPQPPSDVEGG